MAYKEVKTQADSLRKQKRYSEALPLYEDLWKNHRQECTEWDGWGYAQCHYHLKDYAKALDICREVYSLKPDFAHIRNLYAWCIYQTEMKQGPAGNPDRFLRASQAIMKLSTQEDEFSPYVATVFKTALIYEEPFNAEKVLEWTSRLNLDLLSAEARRIDDGQGAGREFASPKEKYFALRSEALLQKGNYEECISLCDEALAAISNFHHDNDLWLKRRKAGALHRSGRHEQALSIMKEVLARKRDWFIKKEIAEIYKDKGDEKPALAYAAEAALDRGEMQMKVKLYELLAALLRSLGREEEARKHVELVYRIRLDNGWKMPDEFRALAESCGIGEECLRERGEIHSELGDIWNSIRFRARPRLEGKIAKILPTGQAGFIETPDRRSYYFRMDSFQGKRSEARPGLRVSFSVEEGFDKKKNKPSEVAVGITAYK